MQADVALKQRPSTRPPRCLASRAATSPRPDPNRGRTVRLVEHSQDPHAQPVRQARHAPSPVRQAVRRLVVVCRAQAHSRLDRNPPVQPLTRNRADPRGGGTGLVDHIQCEGEHYRNTSSTCLAARTPESKRVATRMRVPGSWPDGQAAEGRVSVQSTRPNRWPGP
jgi:hypothetical protein